MKTSRPQEGTAWHDLTTRHFFKSTCRNWTSFGCAILAVLFYHAFYWSGAGSSYRLLRLFIQSTVVGWLGVNLFFVLSGFLITGILLDTRGHPFYFRGFYRRRSLRILPAYLATICILLFLHWINTPSALLAVMFLANYDHLFSVFHLPIYRSFWSLAVEEQFYSSGRRSSPLFRDPRF